MKKIIAMLLVLVMVMAMAACGADADKGKDTTAATTAAPTGTTAPATDPTNPPAPAAMTYAEYAAAELESEVVVDCYVQAAQGWWFDSEVNSGVITVYAQDPDGAYFLYEMKCEEADAEKLVPGTKIRVSGVKTEWEGEVEIIEATFEFVDDADSFIAEPMDATELLGTEDLIQHQNKLVAFYGLTVKGIEYQGGEPGKDIYVTLTLNDADYSFCVESYLTGPDSDLYKLVGTLKAGDKVDVEGFLYWYRDVNVHITAIAGTN